VHLLGVPPTTVRRWADAGLLEVQRTPGGHRRFRRDSVLALHRQVPGHAEPAPAAPPWTLDTAALAHQQWHAHLQSPAGAGRMRGLGQRLLGLLIQYLTRREDDARFLAEGREIGESYGLEAAQSAASLHDVVEAFLFFRSSFLALALQVPTAAHAGDAGAIAHLWQRADRFMNEVLLGTVAGYETAIAARKDEAAPWT
jgi:excisionase family DNA binding protein